jgi:hypothetical protein
MQIKENVNMGFRPVFSSLAHKPSRVVRVVELSKWRSQLRSGPLQYSLSHPIIFLRRLDIQRGSHYNVCAFGFIFLTLAPLVRSLKIVELGRHFQLSVRKWCCMTSRTFIINGSRSRDKALFFYGKDISSNLAECDTAANQTLFCLKHRFDGSVKY